MIIRLMNANFSANNIGELNKFTIRVHGSGLASSEFTSPVDKGATATIKVTLNSGFTTDDISVKMSGDPITPTISSTGTNEYTITIPNVTGYIVVQVGEVESGTGLTNYALPYTEWNWLAGFPAGTFTREENSFSWSGVENGTSVVFGHRYALADTPFNIGDTFYFGVRDLVKDGGNYSLCFMKADGTEITPRLNGTVTSPISYLTKEIPAETAQIQIRFHGSSMVACSGGKAYLSTVAFDENTEWKN